MKRKKYSKLFMFQIIMRLFFNLKKDEHKHYSYSHFAQSKINIVTENLKKSDSLLYTLKVM